MTAASKTRDRTHVGRIEAPARVVHEVDAALYIA